MKEIGMDSLKADFLDSPERFAWGEAYLSDQTAVQALFDAVDDSPYSLSQWIDAFVLLGRWMDARGLRSPFQDQLGYVTCACEAAGAGASLTTLPATVSEMLEEYGFECAVKK